MRFDRYWDSDLKIDITQDEKKRKTQNEPQAEVKNENDPAQTDEIVVPGDSETAHGGNESTKQTDSASAMEDDGLSVCEQNGNDEQNESASEQHDRNSNAAFGEKRVYGKVAREFRRFIESIGQIVVGEKAGSDILSVREAVRRVANRKPLTACYADEIKSYVVVLIDNSGSMTHSEELMNGAFDIASRLSNVRVYWAPNGCLESEAAYEDLAHAEVVVYVGDFDGANTPIEIAMKGKTVYWVCPELGRYKRITEHDWVSYSESDIKRLILRKNLIVYRMDELDGVESVMDVDSRDYLTMLEREYVKAIRAVASGRVRY